jgi:hypothetical protein
VVNKPFWLACCPLQPLSVDIVLFGWLARPFRASVVVNILLIYSLRT